jgi:hypothetical protein
MQLLRSILFIYISFLVGGARGGQKNQWPKTGIEKTETEPKETEIE